MYIGRAVSFEKSQSESRVPEEVQRLFPREREVATIVYKQGIATAREVEAKLSSAISNAALRSMLNRLVRKGLLTRQKCGPHGTFLYAPVLTMASAKELALRQFSDDYFGGSLAGLADAIAHLFAGERNAARRELTKDGPRRVPAPTRRAPSETKLQPL